MTLFEAQEIFDYWAAEPPIGLAFNGFMRGLSKSAGKSQGKTQGWRQILGDPFGAGIKQVRAPPPPKAEELHIFPVHGYPLPIFDLEAMRRKNHERVIDIARRNAAKGVR